MTNTSRDLLNDIKSLAVVDAHEHLYGHSQSQPCTDVTSFITGSYMASMLPYADRAIAQRVLDTTREDRDRWNDFLKIWSFVRCTGYGNMIVRMLRSWGLSDDLTESSYDAILERLKARSPEESRRAYKEERIECTITHYLAHPSCGGIENVSDFLSGTLTFDAGFHPLLGTLPLHEFHGGGEIEALARVCDVSITKLDDLLLAVGDLINKVAKLGVVGLKDHAAYTRGLSYGQPDRYGAEAELRRLLAGHRFEQGARKLSDYIFHHIVRLSIDIGLPIAIHTGFLVGSADPKANLRNFVPIFESYPEARFDLYHLNYPWLEDLLAVLKRFPNTWANCCWTHIIDPAGTVHFLQRALGTIPANRIFGYGGDFVIVPEPVLAHLEIARENIAIVLDEAVRRNWCSTNTALDIARLWLSENPKSLYGL